MDAASIERGLSPPWGCSTLLGQIRCVGFSCSLCWLPPTRTRSPENRRKKAEEPFRVYVTASPETYEEQILAAKAELEKRLAKNKNWFRVVDSAEDAEIIVDLFAYWTRSERKYMSTWGVVPPTEDGQPDKTQIFEIITYHSLRARVTTFSGMKAITAERTKKDNGRAKDAVKNLAKQLEEMTKASYWDWMERRGQVKDRSDVRPFDEATIPKVAHATRARPTGTRDYRQLNVSVGLRVAGTYPVPFQRKGEDG